MSAREKESNVLARAITWAHDSDEREAASLSRGAERGAEREHRGRKRKMGLSSHRVCAKKFVREKQRTLRDRGTEAGVKEKESVRSAASRSLAPETSSTRWFICRAE